MSIKKFTLFTIVLLSLSLGFSSCGGDDAQDVVNCYEDHVNQSTINNYSNAVTAWVNNLENKELCEEAKAANKVWLEELLNYAKCARDNGVELQAGFDNIDEQIANLESEEDGFDCE